MSTRTPTVLLVDQDDAWREALGDVLRTKCRVLRAASGETALSMLTREEVDVLLVDLVQPGISAFETLRITRENFDLTEVIVTGAEPDVEAAVESVKLGAFHFAPKSAGADTVRALVARALERQSLTRQVQVLSAEASETADREFIVGPSRALRDVVDLVRRVAPLTATVLVLGESGTGKELLARVLHRQGPSPDGPFVAVNLRGDSAGPGRKRAVRPREGRVHRRDARSRSASSNWPPAARCSWTRSATCGWTCRPSCCARFRRAKSSGSAAPARSRPTSGWSRPPTSTSTGP